MYRTLMYILVCIYNIYRYMYRRYANIFKRGKGDRKRRRYRKKEMQNRKCKKANGGAMLKVLSTDNGALERATKEKELGAQRSFQGNRNYERKQ